MPVTVHRYDTAGIVAAEEEKLPLVSTSYHVHALPIRVTRWR